MKVRYVFRLAVTLHQFERRYPGPVRSERGLRINRRTETVARRFAPGQATRPDRGVSNQLQQCETHPWFLPRPATAGALPLSLRWRPGCNTNHARLDPRGRATDGVAPTRTVQHFQSASPWHWAHPPPPRSARWQAGRETYWREKHPWLLPSLCSRGVHALNRFDREPESASKYQTPW